MTIKSLIAFTFTWSGMKISIKLQKEQKNNEKWMTIKFVGAFTLVGWSMVIGIKSNIAINLFQITTDWNRYQFISNNHHQPQSTASFNPPVPFKGRYFVSFSSLLHRSTFTCFHFLSCLCNFLKCSFLPLNLNLPHFWQRSKGSLSSNIVF